MPTVGAFVFCMPLTTTIDSSAQPVSSGGARRPADGAASLRRHWPLALALALVAVWVFVPAQLNPGQWGDHFEQFVWAHSLEWGYYKHPPLPTWLLAGLIALFGPSPNWTYLLAALCTGGTAYFTYRIAGRLLPPGLVGLSMLLWGLQQAFSMRAQVFNHNTVMMVAVSAAAWCVLQAVATRSWRWWWAAGLAAGAAMLSKYQSIVPLAGIVVGLVLTGELRWRAAPQGTHQHTFQGTGQVTGQGTRRGLLLATTVAAPVIAPHWSWVVAHDFTTLRYAGQGSQYLPWSERGLSLVSFLAQQVRLLFPALLFALLLRFLPGRPSATASAAAAPIDAESLAQQQWRRAWLVALVAFPLVVTLLTCPVFGLRLQNHWGYQCLQFVSLWLAWSLRSLARRPSFSVAATALSVQLVAMGWWVGAQWTGQAGATQRIDTSYPAKALAAAVQRDWSRMTACPLKIVVGPSFEAGMVSTYLPNPPRVLEGGDFRKSPWVRADELQTLGAVYVATNPADLPEHGVMVDSMLLHPDVGRDGGGGRVYWAIVPPPVCDQPPAPPDAKTTLKASARAS